MRSPEQVRQAKRRDHARRVHGLTLEEYEALLQRRCDWCSVDFKAKRVDGHWCSWTCRKRAIGLRRSYAMTADDLRASLAAQGFRCAACGEPITMDDRHIDHDHTSGRLRGILCVPCNLTLGNAREDIGRLRALAGYLAR